jgi:uncharacterized protein
MFSELGIRLNYADLLIQETSMTEEMEAIDTLSKDERLWGMLCHLTAFSGYLIPFGSVLGPLVVWMIKKDEIPFVDDQGKESLNFQLTMLIAVIVSVVLMFVLIGFVLLGVLIIFQIIVIIMAAIKANDGVKYRYPYTIRFIK